MRAREDQPGPRCQLSLLKPELEFWNWRSFKNNKGKIQLLHPNSSTKERGGKIVSIFHINTDLTAAARNAWVKQGLTTITAQIEPLLKINTGMCNAELQRWSTLLWNVCVYVFQNGCFLFFFLIMCPFPWNSNSSAQEEAPGRDFQM